MTVQQTKLLREYSDALAAEKKAEDDYLEDRINADTWNCAALRLDRAREACYDAGVFKD